VYEAVPELKSRIPLCPSGSEISHVFLKAVKPFGSPRNTFPILPKPLPGGGVCVSEQVNAQSAEHDHRLVFLKSQ
jgi:hypothetical protein